jgi:hypothetical protein
MPAQTLTNRHRRKENAAMKIDEQTRRAIAEYTGPITYCRPGRARGHALKPLALPDDAPKQVPLNTELEAQVMKTDGTAQWLDEHKGIVPMLIVRPIDEAERGRRKKGRGADDRGGNAMRNCGRSDN